MQKVINGLLFDTGTAEQICDVTPKSASDFRNDFRYQNDKLYRTKNGRFFIAGEGGAMSRWATPAGDGSTTGGSGIILVDEDEAKRLVERFSHADEYARLFGAPEEA